MSGEPATEWRCCLVGERAVRAAAIVDELAQALDDAADEVATPALIDGAAGRALLFGYLDRAWPERGHDARMVRWLDRAIDLVATRPYASGLFTGYTGVAWVVEHLAGGGDNIDDEDPNSDIDDALCEALRSERSRDHDLTDGLAGIGAYALERWPRGAAAELLGLVVSRLDDAAERAPDGVAWRSYPADEVRARYPDGYHDMGVAHGVVGPIAILAAATALGVERAIAAPLLDGAWRWMMAGRLAAPSGATFPFWRAADRPASPARSAWCYGDPGAARALFVAARACNARQWIADARAIALHATRRPKEDCGCTDSGLCHGAAGLAHLYNRWWQDTGDSAFARAAEVWYDDVLTMPRQPDSSLLTGAAGVALALTAAISPIEPAWDRILLASLAAGGA